MFSFFFILMLHATWGGEFCEKGSDCKNLKDRPIILQNSDVNNYQPLLDASYVIPKHRLPQVLWWNDHIFPYYKDQQVKCSLGSCLVTKDRNKLSDHLTRGVIIYGSDFKVTDLPLPRLPHHEWALFHEESPKNNWLLSTQDGISLFNHTATFHRASDYPLSTQFIRDTNDWLDDEYFVATKEKNRLQKDLGLSPLVYFQRDCRPPSERDAYVTELMKFVKIDSYGPCTNNKQPPDDIVGFHRLSSKPYYHFLARYKFQLAFENALCEDYMTEKLFRALHIGSVPVYLGSNLAQEFMPSDKAVVMVKDFKSPKELADFIKGLNNDDVKYNEYLSHRNTKRFTNPHLRVSLARQRWKLPSLAEKRNFGHYMCAGYTCHVCDRVHERNNNLRDHLRDPHRNAPLPARRANRSHMPCGTVTATQQRSPTIVRALKSAVNEAASIIKMVHANETESKLFTEK